MPGRLAVRTGCDVVPAVEDGTVPLQNRVLPTGEIIADPARGLMMGNRGCLHRQGRELGVSRWRSKAWICCVLDWKDVRRDPMPPGRWTALFFLDEATALAADRLRCRGWRVRPGRGADAAGDHRGDRGRLPANGPPDRVAWVPTAGGMPPQVHAAGLGRCSSGAQPQAPG